MLGLRFSGYNFKVSILVAIGTIATAYGLAIIGSTIGQPSFYAFFNLTPDPTNPAYYHTSRMIAALNACYSAGAVAGCFTNAFIVSTTNFDACLCESNRLLQCDILGRKRSIMIGCLLLILGGGLCSGAQNLGMFFAGRVVSGLGGGILGCAVPIYQAEVSTPETRGFMVCREHCQRVMINSLQVCLTGVAFAWGYTLAGWMGYVSLGETLASE
jgi:MFS family permease